MANNKLIISIIVIVIILIVLIMIGSNSSKGSVDPPDPPPSNGKTLYDRLGGIFPIAAVVNNFSDALITNPVVGVDSPNPYLRDWSRNKQDRLPGLKFMRTLWLASIAGGPFKYTPIRPGKCPFSLENAHATFQISPAEFDAVAAELSKSLDLYHVPAQEKGEVLAAFAAHKDEVNYGYDVAHHLPLPTIKC